MERLSLRLDEADALPDLLLRLSPRQVRQVFPEPTLVRLPGGDGAPLFMSCLLHGNETTGFTVLQRLARWAKRFGLPRPMLILVGNVHAAEAGRRRLDSQLDYNRIWEGGDQPEHDLARRVIEAVAAARPFAAIDIHNNTGTNPLYACINSLEPDFQHLASLFSPTVVHFENPSSVLSMAMSKICPSVTIEAGKPGEPAGIERAFDLVMDTLHMSEFSPPGPARPITIYHTVGRMEIDPGARFAFSQTTDASLGFAPDMDHWNFIEQPAGTAWAHLAEKDVSPLRVFDEDRQDITGRFFRTDGDTLRLVRPATPSMITLDASIIRADCLGYLMEPMAV